MSHSGRLAALVSFFLAAAWGATFENVLFFGGNGADVTKAITTDGSFFYVLGETTSTNLPNATGRNQGGGDLFVLKYDPRNRAAVWVAYVGGSGRETAAGISVDARGNVWVAGTTASADFPVTPDALQRTFGGGGSDAFLAQLNARGTGLRYATFLGGSGAESNALFATDGAGNHYLAGTTGGGFPVKSGSVQTTFGGGASDVFVVKLGAAGTQVEFASYLGGSGADTAGALAVDDSGSVFLSGSTASPNYPVSDSAYRKQNAGGTDAFATRLNPAGTGLLFSTYLGGSGTDASAGITPTAGGAYVSVTTSSRGLFTSPGAFLSSFSGGPSDGYVARLSPDGSQVTSATYLGGAGEDVVGAIGVAADRVIRVLFASNSEYWGEAAVAGKPRAAGPRASGPAAEGPLDPQSQGLNESLTDVEEHVEIPQNCEGLKSELAALIARMITGGMASGGSANISNPGACAQNATAIGTPEDSTATMGWSGRIMSVPQFKQSSTARYTGTVGDPVSTATGELYDTFVDLTLGGPMRFAFARYYGSALNDSGVQSALGNHWMHVFDQTAEVSGNTASVLLFQGKRIEFTRASATAPWQLTTKLPNGYQLISDAAGLRLLSYASRNVFHFNAAGQLVKIEDRNGNALTVTPGPFGPAQVSDGMGRVLTFTYTGSKLTKVADQAGRTVSFAHTGGNLTSVTGLNGRATTYTYEPGPREGLLGSITLPAGNRVLLNVFDENGRVVRQSDSRNQATTIAYGQGQTTVTNPAGVTTRHSYGAGVDLAGMADDQGRAASIQVDESGRRTGFTDKLGKKTSFSFDAATGYLASFTDALGNTTAYTWTAQQQGAFTYYNLTQVRHPDGSSERFAHDAKGNVVTETLRDGSQRKHIYNARGQVLTIANALDGVTTFVYNDDGTLRSVEDAGGARSEFGYDTAKQPIRVTRGDNATREYSYTPSGRPARAVDELGAATANQYDANDRLAAVTDALGTTWQRVFDGDGRTASFTDRTGGVTQFDYDAAGRLASKKTPGGRAGTFTYNAAGKVATLADEVGKVADYTYTAEGFLAASADALGRTTKFDSDAMGRVTAITAPSGAVASAQYNAFGLRTSMTDALGRVTQFSYDARGQVVEARAPGGAATKWERDALGNVTRIVDPNGNGWTRTYDAAGRMTKRTDPLEQATGFSYHGGGRLASIATPEGSVELTYDAAGRIASKTYSDGTAYQFERDKLGRVVKANGAEFSYDAEGRMTNSNGLAIERDADGRIAAVTYAEGKTVRYTYDPRGRLAGIADWAGGGVSLSYNAADEVTEAARVNGVAGKYEYDADGRLVRLEEGSLSTIALTRNAGGEIVEADRKVPAPAAAPAGEQEFAYDAAHRIATATYDKLGRLLSDGRTYRWDLASNLTGWKEGEQEASFTYDAFGGLTGWTQGERQRAFVQNYALALPSVAIERRNGADATYYVHAPDGRLLYSISAADGQRRYYHFDEAGNTAFLTDDAGAVVESYGVTPYGESVGGPAESENLFVYQGAYGVLRVAPGLYNMRARYYDANAARFLSRDPVQSVNPSAASPYVYVSGNPLAQSDPTGRWFRCDLCNWIGSKLGLVKEEPARPEPQPEPAPAPESTSPAYGIDSFDYGWEPPPASYTPASDPPRLVTPAPLVSAPVPLPLAGDSGYQAYCGGLTLPGTTGLASSPGSAGSGIVAVGGANIVALGGGNFTVNGVQFRVEGSRIVALGGGNIVALGGGNIVALGGANIVALGGGNFSVNGIEVETNNGAIVAVGGANLVGLNASGLLALTPAELVGLNGTGVIANGGGNVVAMGGAN